MGEGWQRGMGEGRQRGRGEGEAGRDQAAYQKVPESLAACGLRK